MTFFSMVMAFVVIGSLMIVLRTQKEGTGVSRKSAPDYVPTDTSDKRKVLDPEFVSTHWAEIQAMMKVGGAGMKNALIEADKLLDYVMIARGFAGEDMGGRLKLNGNKFSDLNAIWSAHKLRNRYAHEVHIDIVPREVEQAVTSLGQGIRDLGVPV